MPEGLLDSQGWLMAKNPNKKLPPHIVARGGVYQYVRRVPNDIREHPDWVGKDLIRRSLKTGDLRVAAADAAIIDGEIEKAFRKARADMRLASMPRVIEAMTDEEAATFIDRATGWLASARAWDGYMGVVQKLPEPTARSLIDWACGLEKVTVTETVRTRLEQKLYESAAPRLDSSSHGQFLTAVRADAAPKHEPPPPPQSRTFDEVWAEFQKDPSRDQKLDYTGYTTAIDLVREICGGNRNVRSITRDEMKRVRSALITMPTYAKVASRWPEYDGWKYEDIAADVRARLEDGDEIATIKPKVINKYLDNVERVFKFAVHEGYIESSPASNLSVKANSTEFEREPFSMQQLSVVFPSGWTPNTDVDWMLLLALLQGFRGNEIAQLECSDVFVKDGTHSISISPHTIDEHGNIDHAASKTNGKSVKTKSGQRTVPVHWLAIDFGFLDFVRDRKRSSRRLLTTNSWGKRESFYESIRDDIDAHLDRIGVKTEKTTFHSLRHNFRDACGNALIETAYLREMGGWSRGGAESGYGKGTSPAVLKPMIDKIKYDIPIFKKC